MKQDQVEKNQPSQAIVSFGSVFIEQTAKVFVWDEVKRGDCTMRTGATMTVFADGSYEWKADVSSTDSNDNWEGHFEWLSSGNALLCRTNDQLMYHMEDENKWYRWQYTAAPEECRAERFNDIHHVAIVCSC